MIRTDLKPESDAGPSLHLILLFDHSPRRQPWFWELLVSLTSRYRLALTAIYNGQPYDFDEPIRRLELYSFQSHSLPLRLEPEQILAGLLAQDLPAAPARLWLQAESLWRTDCLQLWLEQLSEQTLLMPAPLPAGFGQERRRFQSLVPVVSEMHLLPVSLLRLPDCLIWGAAEDSRLEAFVKTGHELKLVVDTGCRIWAEPSPPRTESALDWARADVFWQIFDSRPDALQLQALLARSPASVRLYPFVAQLLPTELALDLLSAAFKRSLLSPMMLQAAEALLVTEQPQAAAACRAVLAARFGSGTLSESAAPTGWAACLPWRESLSVCLIVRNEAELITDCLQSVKTLADELIVVDTGSQDQTPALAEALGAQVFHQVWTDDFAKARNASLAQAGSDWILVIDADERLTPDSRTRLLELLWNPPPGLPRLQLQIQNLSASGEVSLVHFVPRLFPCSPWLSYQGRIHEDILLQCQGFSVSPERPGIRLLHLGYTAEMIADRGKARRNLELLSCQQAESPDEPQWMSYLADALSACSDNESALRWYQRVLVAWEQGHVLDERVLLRNLEQLISLLLRLKRPQAALDLVARFELQLMKLPNVWYARAEAHLMLKDEILARACLEQCMSFAHRPEGLAGVTYRPACVTNLPQQQLIRLAASGWRQGESPAELVTRLGQWFLDGYRADAGLPDPLLFWAEARDKGLELPVLPDELIHTPMGIGLMDAMVWLQTEKAPEFLWQDLELSAQYEFCRKLWQSGDARALCLSQALLYLDFIRSLRPGSILLLTLLMRESRQPDLALMLLQAARERLPDNLDLLTNEAMLLFETGCPDPAVRLLEQILVRDPDFEAARTGLEVIHNWQQKQISDT